ncbi:MAG TPA: aminotransferase class I/II-fold pyridoxal phosphate-dependent enzyme [Acidimicrobiia bacterium]|jgi:pyridoxal phosphate-dependent aminotransferase EpsN|nr:aminotransferase class I/II-fold pyridoxal phosphate-dependent enzyme [Acidimicrobiia bacterium]
MARIYLSAPDLAGTELGLVSEAIASNWIAPLGPHVDAFEAEMSARLDVPHAVALSSGTAALHLALLALRIGAGDEVWASTLTFAATANAIHYVGATPVFLDSEQATWNLDPVLLAEELRAAARRDALPKALIVVDLYGQCANYEPIVSACREHGVWLIEDAAEALGATYRGRPAGSFGDLSILSFNGNKIITTSGGGMLLGARAEWIERARYLATQARERAAHYEHVEVGYNYRLSNLLAAVGRAQLADLDRRVAARRAINARYRAALADLPGWTFTPEPAFGRSTFWLTCALMSSSAARDHVIAALAREDIEARPLWKPMHRQPAFARARAIGGTVAERLFETGLCLPSGSGMTASQLEHVIHTIRATA